MTDRLYFFRSDEGYEIDEMRKRVRVEEFRNPDNEPVRNLIEEGEINNSDLDKSKESLHSTLRRKLTDVAYHNFVTNIFEDNGEKGDKFNLQLYFTNEIDREDLIDTLEKNVSDVEPEELKDNEPSKSLHEYKSRVNNAVDLRFVWQEDYDEEGGEAAGSPPSESSFVEVRIYPEKQVIAVSNRGFDIDQQSRIRKVIRRWADTRVKSQPDLMENELLALQNSIDGRNCGIDYGDFQEKTISTAKYRGQRNLALSRSRIIQPARQDGRLVGLRCYCTCSTGSHEWETQVRLHKDGHITSSKYTQSEFVDDLVAKLSEIHQHTDKLGSLNEGISGFIDDLMVRRIIDGRKNYRSSKHSATEAAIEFLVNDDKYQRVEIQLYESLLFNLGTELIQLQQQDELGSISVTRDDPPQKAEIKGLFDNWAEYKNENPKYEFSSVWDHLHALFTGSYESPLELVQTASDKYGI